MLLYNYVTRPQKKVNISVLLYFYYRFYLFSDTNHVHRVFHVCFNRKHAKCSKFKNGFHLHISIAFTLNIFL